MVCRMHQKTWFDYVGPVWEWRKNILEFLFPDVEPAWWGEENERVRRTLYSLSELERCAC